MIGDVIEAAVALRGVIVACLLLLAITVAGASHDDRRADR